MDDAELKAQVARAEAERDLAQQSLARTKRPAGAEGLVAVRAGAGRSHGAEQRGPARAAQGAAGAHPVRAPFAGVVGQRLVSLGDYVTTDTRLVSLQTVSPQRAAFQVPERYADQLKVGQQVTFRVAALPGREFTGRVDFVDPVVQLPGRTITVKAVTPNPKRALQSGMFIEARLATAVRPSAVVIPEDAVVALQGSTFVWVVRQGKATRRQVDLGVRTPGFVEARSGVERCRAGRGRRPGAAGGGRAGGCPRSWTGNPVTAPGGLIVRLLRPRRSCPASPPRSCSRRASGAGASARGADHSRRAHRLPRDLHLRRRARLPRLARSEPGRGVRIGTLATSVEGRRVPWVLAVAPAGRRTRPRRIASGKPVVWLQANIHAGEVEGKEAAQMLLRDLTRGAAAAAARQPRL